VPGLPASRLAPSLTTKTEHPPNLAPDIRKDESEHRSNYDSSIGILDQSRASAEPFHAESDSVLGDLVGRADITEPAVQRIVQFVERKGFIRRKKRVRKNRYRLLTETPVIG
jgi:hypothetical protein